AVHRRRPDRGAARRAVARLYRRDHVQGRGRRAARDLVPGHAALAAAALCDGRRARCRRERRAHRRPHGRAPRAGPPRPPPSGPTLWCVLRGWDRDTQRAVFQSFNLAMQAATLVAYAIGGLITAEALRMFALIAPAMLLPSLIGVRLYARFSDATFRTLVLVLL